MPVMAGMHDLEDPFLVTRFPALHTVDRARFEVWPWRLPVLHSCLFEGRMTIARLAICGA